MRFCRPFFAGPCHAYILIRNSRAGIPKCGPLSWQWAPYHVYLPLPMAAGSITFFVGPPNSARQHMHAQQKRKNKKKKKKKKEEEEEEPIARLKQREKLRSKGKSCTKTNSCNPKVTVTDKSSKEGLRWPVWNGGSRSFARSSSSGRESSSETVRTIW